MNTGDNKMARISMVFFVQLLVLFLILPAPSLSQTNFSHEELKNMIEFRKQYQERKRKQTNVSLNSFISFMNIHYGSILNDSKIAVYARILLKLYGNVEFNHNERLLVSTDNQGLSSNEKVYKFNLAPKFPTNLSDQKSLAMDLIDKDVLIIGELKKLVDNDMYIGCATGPRYFNALVDFSSSFGNKNVTSALRIIHKHNLVCLSESTKNEYQNHFGVFADSNLSHFLSKNLSIASLNSRHFRQTLLERIAYKLEEDFKYRNFDPETLNFIRNHFVEVAVSVNPTLTNSQANLEIDLLIQEMGTPFPQLGVFNYGISLLSDAVTYGQYDIVHMLNDGFSNLSNNAGNFIKNKFEIIPNGLGLDPYDIETNNYSDIEDDYMNFFGSPGDLTYQNLATHRIAMSIDFGRPSAGNENRDNFMNYQTQENQFDWSNTRISNDALFKKIINTKMNELGLSSNEDNWEGIIHKDGSLSIVSGDEDGFIVENYEKDGKREEWAFYGKGYDIQEVIDDISDVGDKVEGGMFNYEAKLPSNLPNDYVSEKIDIPSENESQPDDKDLDPDIKLPDKEGGVGENGAVDGIENEPDESEGADDNNSNGNTETSNNGVNTDDNSSSNNTNTGSASTKSPSTETENETGNETDPSEEKETLPGETKIEQKL